MILVIDSKPRVMRRPAMMMPRLIKRRAARGRIPKTKAIKAPVQPPLPGRGIATKETSSKAPTFWKRAECL